MVDIFNPQVSVVTKGLEGKLILIYGTNRTGKTSNAVKATKPLVVGFERGLNAISGVPYVPIKNWNDWTNTVKQLTGAKSEEAKKLYQTIIVDTIDAMGDLAAEYVSGVYGVPSIGAGNRGYGLWKEYSAEINKWLRLLTNAGYTVIFIAHDDTREFLDEKGEKYSKVYPRGDKRVVDPIADLCDFICFAQPVAASDGSENLSTLYLVGSRSFHAGSRFKYITPSINEWNMEKLEQAISDAIAAEEKQSGKKSGDFKTVKKAVDKATASPYDNKTITELIELCVAKGQKSLDKTGSPDEYLAIMQEELGTNDFKASAATEQQRQQVIQLIEALTKKGY